MITREEFVEECIYCLGEEQCNRLFDCTVEEMENGIWNMALEFAYNTYCSELEYEEEKCRCNNI